MALVLQMALASATGIISHLGYFIDGEHHLQAPKLLKLYSILPLIVFLFECRFHALGFQTAIVATVAVVLGYAASLFSSIVIYRLFFHRLKDFPGPSLARVSKIYHAWQVRGSNQYLWLEQLHQQYGDFVRTGPNEITIFTPKAIPKVYGFASKCSRSPWYEMVTPLESMILTRSKSEHAKRRKIWDSAFNTQETQKYEGRICSYAQALGDALASFSNQPVNATEWFKYFAFDTMTDLQFGKGLGMLRNGKDHWAITLSKAGVDFMGPLTPLPWLSQILINIPGGDKDFKAFKLWANDVLQLRIQTESAKPDHIGHAIKEAEAQGGVNLDYNYKWLHGDFLALIGAGSETVLSTMTCLFSHLATSPDDVKKLRAELAGMNNIADSQKLLTKEHLNAVINETLRLHPAIPSGGLRDTPPEGLTVDGTYIPGNTTVLIPHYSLGRSSSCFTNPSSFLPERWSTEPQLITDATAFIPFSLGKYSCVGKNLALMELRIVTALLVTRFDIELAEGEDGRGVFEGMKDSFTAAPGRLNLIFRKI